MKSKDRKKLHSQFSAQDLDVSTKHGFTTLTEAKYFKIFNSTHNTNNKKFDLFLL